MAEFGYTEGSGGGLAPAPRYPERDRGSAYEQKSASNGARRGPLRFQEGLATDTDLPSGFSTGAMSGYETAPGRPNHNKAVWIKTPAETMGERAHAGSASWIDSADMLGGFMEGANVNANSARRFEQVTRSGGRYERLHGAIVSD